MAWTMAVERDVNMDMDNGSLDDRIMAAQNNMRLIIQRTFLADTKMAETRLHLLEENQVALAKALLLLLAHK